MLCDWGGSCYIMYSMLCELGRLLLHSVQYVVCNGEVPANNVMYDFPSVRVYSKWSTVEVPLNRWKGCNIIQVFGDQTSLFCVDLASNIIYSTCQFSLLSKFTYFHLSPKMFISRPVCTDSICAPLVHFHCNISAP
jgi:hypothetical protein